MAKWRALIGCLPVSNPPVLVRCHSNGPTFIFPDMDKLRNVIIHFKHTKMHHNYGHFCFLVLLTFVYIIFIIFIHASSRHLCTLPYLFMNLPKACEITIGHEVPYQVITPS